MDPVVVYAPRCFRMDQRVLNWVFLYTIFNVFARVDELWKQTPAPDSEQVPLTSKQWQFFVLISWYDGTQVSCLRQCKQGSVIKSLLLHHIVQMSWVQTVKIAVECTVWMTNSASIDSSTDISLFGRNNYWNFLCQTTGRILKCSDGPWYKYF
jgi:hypothetical protein